MTRGPWELCPAPAAWAAPSQTLESWREAQTPSQFRCLNTLRREVSNMNAGPLSGSSCSSQCHGDRFPQPLVWRPFRGPLSLMTQLTAGHKDILFSQFLIQCYLIPMCALLKIIFISRSISFCFDCSFFLCFRFHMQVRS